MNNIFSLINKNIILTGAAGILGQQLSQAYLNAGANLALLDFNEDALNTLRNKLYSNKKSNFITYKVDLTKENEVNNTINAIAN